MENHELDINKRYKNVSKTWDRDPFSNVFQSRLIDEVEPYLQELSEQIELKTDESLYDKSVILTGGEIVLNVPHTNLDKVFDEMEDEKHSLETNDVYDWTKPISPKIQKMMEDASTMVYKVGNVDKRVFKVDINNISPDEYNLDTHPLAIGNGNVGKERSTGYGSENFRKLIEEVKRTNEIKKSLSKGLSDILEDEVGEVDEGQSWLKDSLLSIGEYENSIAEPKLDTIEKAPQYNSEVFPEVIVMMEDNFKIIATMCFAKLNSFKYRMRTGLKDVKKIEEDIKKAMNYESRYKVFLQKMKSIFYKDKVLPLIIGDETFEMKVVGDDYEQEIKNIKLYLQKYATETK